MAILKVITENLAADATTASATTDLASVTPFIVGGAGITTLVLTGVTGTPTIKIQTSADASSWTDAVTLTAITNSVVKSEITLKRYIRLNPTVAGSAGKLALYLEV